MGPAEPRRVNELRSSDELQSPKDFALLLIGAPSTRKSSIAVRFPSPMVFDCDRKVGNLKVWYPEAKFSYAQPDLDSDGSELPKDKKWERLIDLVKTYGTSPAHKVNVIDSLSRASDYLIDFLMANEPKAKMPTRGGVKTMSEALWYPYKERLSGLIAGVRSLGKPCIFTVHERDVYNDEGAVIGIKPTVSGQLAGLLTGLFTDAWRCKALQCIEDAAHPDGVKYIVRTMPESSYVSLCHSYKVPAEFEFSWKTFIAGYPHLATL